AVALARCREVVTEYTVERQVEIGVLPDHDRVLPAQLERDALEGLCGARADLDAGIGVAGEADDPGVRMVDDRVADFSAGPRDDVDDAVRQPALDEELDES